MDKYPETFPHPGFMSSYITGRKGGARPDPQKLKIIADELHVQFEWLMLGSGPMRRDGRAETPAEQAMRFARSFNIREDAWERAWARNKDRDAEMTAHDWFKAIELEADRLNRDGVPRPEPAAAKRVETRRVKKKLERAREKQAEQQAEEPVAASLPRPKIA